MKQFVKALNLEGDCFKYLCGVFPGTAYEKLKACIFDCPQIRKLINDHNFKQPILKVESDAWEAFVSVLSNFLGRIK